MKAFQIPFSKSLLSLSCLLLIVSGGWIQAAPAAETTLEAQLVWGTNDEASPNPKHTALEEPLAKKLKMFKWKKYYTVNRQAIPLTADQQKVRLSDRCEIQVKPLEGQRYEINVFGKGKHVRKITEKITKQDSLVIAGDDKNDCAWFILIREK